MTTINQSAQTWTKPELVKLGQLKDVAGPAGSGSQAAGGGQFRS